MGYPFENCEGEVVAGDKIKSTTVWDENEHDTNKVRFTVFHGGQAGCNKYLSDNLKYPTQARRMGVEGTVVVVFVVNTDGSNQDVEVVRGIGGGCDEEAVKVVKSSPTWNPGMQKGKAVRTRMRLPIRFKLS